MIRRSPCENYLKYLLVHPDNYGDESIRRLVQMQQLDFIGMPYLERLRQVCVPPTPFFPDDPLHSKSMRFLRKEMLYTIFHPDDAMQEAAGILDHTKAKETVESMLISQSHPAWVCTVLRRQGLDVSEEAISRYKRYYFNVDLVDSSELKALMVARLSSPESGDVDQNRLNNAMSTIVKSDARRSLAMSTSPMTANINNTLRLGLLPTSLDVARLAEATRVAALSGSLDSALRGMPTQGRDYAFIAKMMTEILESTGDPAGDLQEGLAKLAIETESEEVPHINQLTDGSHTLDIQPIDVVAEVEASD